MAQSLTTLGDGTDWYVGSVYTKNDTYLIIPVNKNYQTVTKQIDL